MSTATPAIFISYRHKDAAAVDALVAALEGLARRVPGEEHPETLDSMGHVAVLPWQSGARSDAWQWMDQAAGRAGRSPGPDQRVRGLAAAAGEMRTALGAPPGAPPQSHDLPSEGATP